MERMFGLQLSVLKARSCLANHHHSPHQLSPEALTQIGTSANRLVAYLKMGK